jgi:hypothetical protein
MSVWEKYHFIFYFGMFASFFIFFVFSAFLNLIIIGIVVLLSGAFLSFCLSRRIRCPNCNTPVSETVNYRSRYYRGFRLSATKKCCKCGHDLTLRNY